VRRREHVRGRGATIVGTSGDLPSPASEKARKKVPSEGQQCVVAELAASRSYARDALSDTPEEVVDGCVDALSLYGFCVIDHAIPPADVEALRAECIAATPLIESMRREAGAKQRLTDHELHFLPLFAPHLGNPLVTAVARAVLDSHVRVAQLHVRHVPPDQEETGEPSNAAIMPSGRYKRGWHTDW
jgi:hypothetical protein